MSDLTYSFHLRGTATTLEIETDDISWKFEVSADTIQDKFAKLRDDYKNKKPVRLEQLCSRPIKAGEISLEMTHDPAELTLRVLTGEFGVVKAAVELDPKSVKRFFKEFREAVKDPEIINNGKFVDDGSDDESDSDSGSDKSESDEEN